MAEISVIIPAYNRAEFIQKAIKSVLNQTFKDFELIIIDDGSTDNTGDIIQEYNDKRVKYFHQFNRGPGPARNKGIKKSSGKYLAFLDSDDAWELEKLEIQINEMKDNPEYLLSHTEEIWFKGARRIKPLKIHRKRHGDIFNWSLRLCSVSMSTVMIEKELIDEIGYFDENLEVCEDYDYWLRVTAKYPVLLIDRPFTIKQGGHYDQQSQKYFGLDKFRIYAIEKLIKSDALTKEQLILAFNELKKKCRIYGQGCLKYSRKKESKYYLKLPEKYECLSN